MLTIMKIIYNKHFEVKYPTSPVENPERARLPARSLLEAGYEFVEPSPASQEDIRRAHGLQHIEIVLSSGLVDAVAPSLPAELLPLPSWHCRASPPSHSCARPAITLLPNRAWGLCFFNNMAIAVQKNKAKSAARPDHRH